MNGSKGKGKKNGKNVSDAGAVLEDDASESAPPEKKPKVRKSIFVCIPVEYEESEVEIDGDVRLVRRASRYVVEECPGGPGQRDAVRVLLAKHSIDANNFGDVRMFRSPMRFAISQQTVIKF